MSSLPFWNPQAIEACIGQAPRFGGVLLPIAIAPVHDWNLVGGEKMVPGSGAVRAKNLGTNATMYACWQFDAGTGAVQRPDDAGADAQAAAS